MKRFFKYSHIIGIIGIVLNLILFMTNWYYELVIPFFENSMEDGYLFTFIDYLTYLTPMIFMVLFLVYLIAGRIYMRNHNLKVEEKETEKLVERNNEIQKSLDEKAEFLKHKYYTNCPNCGAARQENKNVCVFCGASLIIGNNKDKKE